MVGLAGYISTEERKRRRETKRKERKERRREREKGGETCAVSQSLHANFSYNFSYDFPVRNVLFVSRFYHWKVLGKTIGKLIYGNCETTQGRERLTKVEKD